MKKSIVIDRAQMKELQTMAADPLDDKLAKRAAIILAIAAGRNTRDIAKEVGVNKDAVTRWRKRFLEGGIDALYSEHGGGATSKSAVPDIREKIRSLLNANPDETWTRKKLAEQLGVSETLVNNELAKMHLTLSRNTSWKFSTTGTTQLKCICIVGIYLSGSASSIIVCTSDKALIPGEEVFLTRNRLLAEQLKKYPKQITLQDVIQTASDHAKETWRKKSLSMQDFLNELISSQPNDPFLSYYAIGFSEEPFLYHGKKPARLVYLPSANPAEWIAHAEQIFRLLSTPEEQPVIMGILESIRHFHAVCTPETEPVLWKKTIRLSNDAAQLQALIPEPNHIEPCGYNSVEEALSSILGAPPVEEKTPEVAMITVVRDKQGITYSVVRSQEVFSQTDAFDLSSPDGFMRGFNRPEKAVIHLCSASGEEATRLFANAGKKNIPADK